MERSLRNIIRDLINDVDADTSVSPYINELSEYIKEAGIENFVCKNVTNKDYIMFETLFEMRATFPDKWKAWKSDFLLPVSELKDDIYTMEKIHEEQLEKFSKMLEGKQIEFNIYEKRRSLYMLKNSVYAIEHSATINIYDLN